MLLILLVAGVTLVMQAGVFLALMVAAVVAAGAAGAAGRAAFWPEHDSDPASSTVLGGIAGFVVGIAYLVPQWIGGADLLALDSAVQAASRIQLFAVVLVALSAGMGFDAVFRRLRERADQVSVRPPDRT